jgi:hypothetical protein
MSFPNTENPAKLEKQSSCFSSKEMEDLKLRYSKRTFIKMTRCMICDRDEKDLKLGAYAYRLSPYAGQVSQNLLFCEDSCKKKAQFVYLNELIDNKLLPTASFDTLIPCPETMEFNVVRTNGQISRGTLIRHTPLGWSMTNQAIVVWMKLGEDLNKPLLLSLLLEANEELRALPVFKNGISLEFMLEEMFKTEFPEFYDLVQNSIDALNKRFFPTSTACTPGISSTYSTGATMDTSGTVATADTSGTSTTSS